MDLVKAAITELKCQTVINDWEIVRMTRNYRKEVLGIEPAVPKIC